MREDPNRPAWQVLEDWRLYRAQLVAQYRSAPVFDESFALDRIYVPLNAWHQVKHDPDAKEERKELRTVVSVKDDMLAWLRDEREKGKLRLVSGGPGSGKSSAMKVLAAELVERGNDGQPVDVLLFPLQRFQWRAGIIESVAVTLNTYSDQMRHNPLDSSHMQDRRTPLLLIFDGLDELTANTEVSEAISATFLRALNTALEIWEGRPVWAIVTGRDAIFGNVEGPTSNLPGERFNLLPYCISDTELSNSNRHEYFDPDSLLSIDNRVEAFRRFSEAAGQSTKELPAAYDNQKLHDVTSQPLLNYFLLTSGPEEFVDGNLAKIYRRLFDRLHARNRNLEARPEDAGKPAAGLSHNQFDRVFEAMAVAAWRTGGTRAASWHEVLTEAEREDSYLSSGEERLCDIFSSQMQDRGAQKPFRLAAGFFMRNQQATGVEFTHKSFGDYLYARRLAKALSEMADGLLQMPAVEKEMLTRWEALTADQRISFEVCQLLHLEIEATVDAESLRKRHDVLAPVIARVFQEGWQVSLEPSMRRAEQRVNQMEEALFVGWRAMWRPDDKQRYWKLGDNTGDQLYRALARQRSNHGPTGDSWALRNWTGADISEVVLSGADLSYVFLANANLQNAQLITANLNFTFLKNANLGGANLGNAILIRTNLQDAELTASFLAEACLHHANLAGATLVDAYLTEASLINTNLTGANLTGADLTQAELTGADLTEANLTGADLTEANFTDANLTNTNLTGADVTNANFNGAKLEGTNFESSKGKTTISPTGLFEER